MGKYCGGVYVCLDHQAWESSHSNRLVATCCLRCVQIYARFRFCNVCSRMEWIIAELIWIHVIFSPRDRFVFRACFHSEAIFQELIIKILYSRELNDFTMWTKFKWRVIQTLHKQLLISVNSDIHVIFWNWSPGKNCPYNFLEHCCKNIQCVLFSFWKGIIKSFVLDTHQVMEENKTEYQRMIEREG